MSNSAISRRYASALFGLGRDDGSFADYGKDLQEFTEFYRENPDFRNVVSNPLFKMEDRKTILEYVLIRSGFSATVKNFLNLLLDKNRIDAIESITGVYSELTDESLNIAHAEIVTARPLKKSALELVLKSLKELTKKEIMPEIKEDRDLIGGMIVKIGSLVLDGSVRAQLEGLKESFKRGG